MRKEKSEWCFLDFLEEYWKNFVRTLQLEVLFLCQNIIKGDDVMAFSDDILEKIFADKETQAVPLGYQSTMIHVIEKVLEEEEQNVNEL